MLSQDLNKSFTLIKFKIKRLNFSEIEKTDMEDELIVHEE